MKFTIGFPIYNKAHMMQEILDGLIENINIECEYIFIFDGCTDNSEEIFDQKSVLLKGTIKKIHTNNLFQLKTNNLLMNEFTSEYLIIFQDDMVLQDKNFINNIEKVIDLYKDKLGIIGCRDGFEERYSDMVGSEFSESNRIIIKSGEFCERSMINIGPIILSKKLINLVGTFDEIYGFGAYEEMEYSLKCKHNYNLINIVLGVDLIHSKFEHKNKKKIKHTNGDILVEQLHKNHSIFKERWYNIAKI